VASFRLDALFDEDMLGDDLEAWLAESALMKRTFRNCAIIAGLIERRFPGQEKSRRQVTISTDLVYDVLRSHQPDHVLLRATRADAATGLLDVRRLGDMLSRIRGRIVHKALDHVSPLAVPVMLEIGREAVYGEAADALLAETEAELVKRRCSEGWSFCRSFPRSGNPDAGLPPSRGRTDEALVVAGVHAGRRLRRRDLLAGGKPARRRRSASRKRFRFCRARRAAAALRHGDDQSLGSC
jgi:hypothetical protein